MKTRDKWILLLLLLSALCLTVVYRTTTPKLEIFHSLENSKPPVTKAQPATVTDNPSGPNAGQADWEPQPSARLKSVVHRAISEKWPNTRLRALISMVRDPALISELWTREPLEVQDLCVLAMHSGTPAERSKAARLWAEADPGNAEPEYILFLERWIAEPSKDGLLLELPRLIQFKNLDSYISERSAAYEVEVKTHQLTGLDGISPIQANDTRSKSLNVMNALSRHIVALDGASLGEKERLAGLTAGLAARIADKRALSITEYQTAIVGEMNVLKLLDDQTEYGNGGSTVADRKAALRQKSEENMAMQDACIQAMASNPHVAELFQQRAQALGEYQAYQQIYRLLSSGEQPR